MTEAEIRKIVGTDKLIIGADRVEKGLRAGKLDKVFFASNYPAARKSQIEHKAALTGVEVEVLEIVNQDLGAVCRKPFPVSVLARTK